MKKVIGWTEDINQCDCCGKQDIKGTFCVEVDGCEMYFGSVCVTKKHGLPVEETKRAVKVYDEAKRAERERQHILKVSNGRFSDKQAWNDHCDMGTKVAMIPLRRLHLADYRQKLEELMSQPFMVQIRHSEIAYLKEQIMEVEKLIDEGIEIEKNFQR